MRKYKKPQSGIRYCHANLSPDASLSRVLSFCLMPSLHCLAPTCSPIRPPSRRESGQSELHQHEGELGASTSR